MDTEEIAQIPAELICTHPLVKELRQNLAQAQDLEANVKLPYVIKDKVLFSPGVWNGYLYTEMSIRKAYLSTDWAMKENRSLFLDHEDNRSSEWIGEVLNVRMDGDKIIGDLNVVDKSTAVKLAYGAKMGISPKVTGMEDEESKSMVTYTFTNWSVVINPACKTTWINNKQKEDAKMVTKKEVKNEEQPEEEASEAPAQEETPTQEAAPEVESAEETVENTEAPAETGKETVQVNADIVKSIQSLNDKFDKVADLLTKAVEMMAQKAAPEKPVEKPKEEDEVMEEEKENQAEVKAMEEKDNIIKTLSEKIDKLQEKFEEPQKVTVRSHELSQTHAMNTEQDIDAALLGAFNEIAPM